jgi:histidyl-tRNA synthetase
MSASKDMQGERIRLASDFWQAGISAEFTYKANPFMPEQMSHATSSGIPICIVLRPTELQEVCYLPAAQTGDLLNSRT